MAVEDWASDGVWWLGKNAIDNSWCLDPPRSCKTKGVKTSWHDSFTEAHAAYLDAVTCEAQTPFPAYTDPRCSRAKEHKGGHLFKGRDGLTDMEQMPR